MRRIGVSIRLQPVCQASRVGVGQGGVGGIARGDSFRRHDKGHRIDAFHEGLATPSVDGVSRHVRRPP